MMVAIARGALPAGFALAEATATRSPPMIVSQKALAASASEVVEIGLREADNVSGIIVGAFGDPGLVELRSKVSIPVTGLCEASMLEAAGQGRTFGVATVTPDLAETIGQRAETLGLASEYSGIRLTPGEPLVLAADLQRMERLLAVAVRECIELDGAQAVIIGGGPLGQAAVGLARQFSIPVIEPIPASVRRLVAMIQIAGNQPS